MQDISSYTNEYLDLKRLSEYSKLGVSTLRHQIKNGGLPCYKIPGAKGSAGKILVKQSEFDAWMNQFAFNRRANIDALADEILNGLRSK